MGSVQLLQATQLSTEQAEFVSIFHICIQQLNTIINDILDFTKMDEDKMILESVPVELRSIVEDSLECISHVAESKSIDLICIVSPDTPEKIVIDPVRLRNFFFVFFSHFQDKLS